MEKREYTVFKFDELTDEQKEKAIQNYCDIHVDYKWWECTYDDAEIVGLKIKGFDIGGGAYCKMEYIESFEDVLGNIIKDHGENCETYKTAQGFKTELNKLEKLPEDEFEDARDDLRDEFLRSISEDYRILLQKQYEYATGKDAIIETLRANDYDFTEDGKID